MLLNDERMPGHARAGVSRRKVGRQKSQTEEMKNMHERYSRNRIYVDLYDNLIYVGL